MNNSFSFKADEETILKIIDFYDYCKVEISNTTIRFRGATSDFTIQIYNTGTVLIQGRQAIYEYSIWQNHNTIISHIGSDEVGTGDYFGPIVVASCLVNKEDVEYLNVIGVKDSKMLSDSKIREIAPLILKRLKVKIFVLSNQKYNQLYNSEKYNLNKIKAYLHNFVLYKLVEETKFTGPVIIDQFCDSELYFKYLNDFKANDILKNVSFYIKAENKFLAVACASIVARFEFLRRIDDIAKETGIQIIKGANSEVDQIAYKLAYKHGIEYLKKYVKFHFANTKKIIKLLEFNL